MKKKLLTAIFACIMGTAGIAGLSACGVADDGSDNSPDNSDKPGQETPSEDETGVEISGVTFPALTATYDGTEKKVEVEGVIPEGVSVSYTSNKATDAGTYNATATLSGEGYKTKKINTTLTIEKAVLTSLTFAGDTVVYDRSPHEITVQGNIPDGVNFTYTCTEDKSVTNSATDAGTYTIKADLTHKNYKIEAPLTATLKIEKAVLSGLTFAGDTVDYDGKPHSVEVAGVIPEGGQIVYSCEEDTTVTNSATQTGSYTITANLIHKNYKLETPLTAKLVIRASGKDRYVAGYNGKIYFANALDKEKLYAYSEDDGVTKISNDEMSGFAVMGSKFYFQSNSLLFSSIKSIDGSASNNVESVAGEQGEYLCTDGSYLYYAQNGLTNGKSGIYKINPTADEPAPVLVSTGKAHYLKVIGSYIYFADGANGNKLSRVSLSANNGARTVVLDEKITCLTAEGSSLYFTVNNLLGDYIARYDVSTGNTVKLTVDAGSCLTVVGNDLYYVNVDLLTSNLFGKGIYKCSANRSSNSNLPGTKVIEKGNSQYSSLTKLSSGVIAYYRVTDQMLCTYKISTSTETEVLDGFVAPETTPISTGSKTAVYGNKIYYLDLFNDKALYSYDTTSGDFARITSCKVSDFSIIGDTLYFNGISYGVNNDLYKVSLTEGGLPEKISTYDCNDLVTDGTNLYYVEKNAAGARTAIHVIKTDGTDEIMYTKGATNLTYYDGYIYFVDGKDLLKMPVTGYTQNGTTKVTDKNVDTFIIDDGVVYFREMYNLNTSKRLSRVNIDGSGYAVMMTKNTDPLKIVAKGSKIYYYTDTVLGTSGIYVLDKSARDDVQPELILERGTAYFAEDFSISGNKIYFVNYYNNLGDSHFYSVDLSAKTAERLDV